MRGEGGGRERTRPPAPGGLCARIPPRCAPDVPGEGTPALAVPAAQRVFPLKAQLRWWEKGVSPTAGQKEPPQGRGDGERSGEKSPSPRGTPARVAPGAAGRGAAGGGSPDGTGSCLSPAEQERGAARGWAVLGAGSWGTHGCVRPRLEGVCPWAEVWRAAGLGNRSCGIPSMRMGRGDCCRWVARREQTAAMFSVDGTQRLQLHVSRLQLDPWDVPCGQEWCGALLSPGAGAALESTLGEHCCRRRLWAGWLCRLSSPSPELPGATPAQWAALELAGQPGARAPCRELRRAIPGHALPAASPGPALAATLAEPGLR